jgi:hypothetical protein
VYPAARAEKADRIAHIQLGRECRSRGDHERAIEHYCHALQIDPALNEVRRDLAEILVVVGRRDEAMLFFHEELSTSGSDGLGWMQELISGSLRSQDLTLAGAYASILAQLRWGRPKSPAAQASAPELALVQAPVLTLTIPKLLHDIEQFEYLRSHRVVGEEFAGIIADYQHIVDQLAAGGIDPRVTLGTNEHRSINHVYSRLVHVRESRRVQQALSERWNASAVEREYLGKAPGIVVVDNLLSDEALTELRFFCLESTVWSANRYARGRLGAFFYDGFNCPLLLQIAEELRQAMPGVIGGRYPLRQLWGFKNTTNGGGDDNLHADFAAINVNFWITPTEANLDDSSGGMVIYDVDAPREWGFEIYNRRADLIKQYLRRHKARPVRIPYRQNRAVIFNSDLFHGTETLRFKSGYEHQRINVTMLFGHRENDAHHPSRPIAESPGGSARANTSWRSSAFGRSGRRRR